MSQLRVIHRLRSRKWSNAVKRGAVLCAGWLAECACVPGRVDTAALALPACHAAPGLRLHPEPPGDAVHLLRPPVAGRLAEDLHVGLPPAPTQQRLLRAQTGILFIRDSGFDCRNSLQFSLSDTTADGTKV